MRRPILLLAAIAMGCGTRTLEAIGPRGDAASEGGNNVAGASMTLAVSYFRIGMTTRDGTSASDAWKSYGADLDSVCTTAADSAASKNTCKRPDGATADSLIDGERCIDNNFGSRLLPMIRSLDPETEKKIGDGIKNGSLTLVLRIDDVAPAGEDGDAPAVLVAAKATKPTFDGKDTWDVDASSVEANDLAKPRAKLAGSVKLVAGKRIWTGTADRLDLPAVFIAGATGTLAVKGVRVEVDLDAKIGTIAGFADVTSVQSIVRPILAQRSICPGNPIYEQVATAVARAADMPAALPHDTTQTCTAMSIGLGVDLVSGTLGKVVPTPDPKPDPCAK